MSELVGTQGRVVALEYNPWLFQLLRRNLSVNGQDNIVLAHRIMAGGKAAAARELPISLMGPSTTSNQSAQFRRGNVTSCIAPMMTLDGLEQGSADLVFVSTNALEQGALQGMLGLMDRSPSLRLIVHFSAQRWPAPRETLLGLANRFPLRFIDADSRAKPITIDKILESSDLSLFLSKAEPR